MSLKRHLFSVLIILLFAGCGIDDYIYLDPVTDTDWRPSDQKITFALPSEQLDDYFQNYVIYYRLYPSTVTKSGIAFTTGDFSSINASMYSDFLSIYPYSTEDDEAPVYLQSLFENTLGYKELTFGTSIHTKAGLGTVTEFEETLLKDNVQGKTLSIDFNLLSLERAHPCLIIDGTKYRILRDSQTTTLPSRDFLYYSPMSGGDFEGTSLTYTYAVFYIVAKGIDDSFSTILSRAAFLGALQLPNEPTT